MSGTELKASEYDQAVAARDDAARRLFEIELALHDAHQSHLDEWIRAACDRLHEAVLRHKAADDLVSRMARGNERELCAAA